MSNLSSSSASASRLGKTTVKQSGCFRYSANAALTLQLTLLFLPTFPPFKHIKTMGDVKLKHFRQNYLEGSNSTKLNTVDVWIPESFPIAPGDGKLWLMWVHTLCHGTFAKQRQIRSWRSMERPSRRLVEF